LAVQVKNTKGKSVQNLAIAVQDGDFVSTNIEGSLVLNLDEPLRMPIRVETEDERFEVKQVAYREDARELLVTVERLLGADEITQILLQDSLGNPFANQGIRYNRLLLTTDNKGIITLEEPQLASEPVMPVSGFSLAGREFKPSQHTLIVTLKPVKPQPYDEGKTIAPATADALVESYEQDFDRITEELAAERYFFEKKNEEIRDEILTIQEKLINENQISPEQKQELRKHLSGLEQALDENSEAIKRSEARTRDALNRLKLLLVEKDSLNRMALGRIQQVEAERQQDQIEFKKKAATYAAIILGLLVILVVIYVSAIKYRKQKNWLKEVNRRLKSLQGELTHNIKELSHSRLQIEEHNQQLETFVYKASHDIKGPLRSIMGLTQVGQMEVKEEAALEYFGLIHKSTKRLDNLLMDLLRLTKTKQAELEKEPINLQQMLDEVVQSFSNSKNFPLIHIEQHLEEGIEFSSDAKLMYSVIQNFVENGIKYCDPHKERPFLKIRFWQEATETHMEFKDNGLGIAQEHLPKIFEMFYKIDSSSDGTGLGLHIVKITIEKLGGYLKVRSSEGKGSVFLLSFPNQ
jgi:signal transduction histidine kinase